jgi:hypothetical protein
MDAHFHGHDGALLSAEYSFAEITLPLANPEVGSVLSSCEKERN